MTRTLRLFHVDAFTTTRGGGNPAVVALDGAQLSGDEMQRLASERHDGDWAFVLPASGNDADLDVRFFSPRKELPFVGHATLALHAVLARFEPRALRRQRGSTGIVEVRHGDGLFSIRQAAPALGRHITADELDEVLGLLGLSRTQLDPRCPPRIAGGASTRLLLRLADGAALDAMVPQLPALAALSSRLGAQGYFPFVLHADAAGRATTEARMFCPAIGIDEDPVSGNAHSMLGVYLHDLGLLPVANGTAAFEGRQGRHVQRPGAVSVVVEVDAANQAVAASIAGHAVVAEGSELRLP